MKIKYSKSVFIFRRDLRLDDNTALLAALRESEQVAPVFILDPRQQQPANLYFSSKAFDFMMQSLNDLQQQLKVSGGKLIFLQGDPESVLTELYHQIKFEAVFVNSDYTPFSLMRDQQLQDWAKRQNVDWRTFDDICLISPGQLLTKANLPYRVFTPFYRAALNVPVNLPQAFKVPKPDFWFKFKESTKFKFDLSDFKDVALIIPGGRTAAQRRLKRALKLIKDKQWGSDALNLDTSSHLAADLKFGLLSAREIFHAVAHLWGPDHAMIRQLIWRDFFIHIGFHFSHIYQGAFHERFNQIRWSHSVINLQAWQNGQTGVPIVDAAMRQLNATGWLSNRARMIAASFLVKDLQISWQVGERYFAQKLIDYDPAVNNGNWQWVAGTGCDAAPYFRVFNPWIQQKKFDPQATYIKAWVPELQQASSSEIHSSKRIKPLGIYPAPIVDHVEAVKKVRDLYL